MPRSGLFFIQPDSDQPRETDYVDLPSGRLPIHFRRNDRARHYILYVRSGPQAFVTIPRRGTRKEAEAFVQRRLQWLERAVTRQQHHASAPAALTEGMEFWFRGEVVRIERVDTPENRFIRLGDENIPIRGESPDLRPIVHAHLRRLAVDELTQRTFALADLHRTPIQRVTVRDQRTRWGSCSRRGTISLNWRLIQTPIFVRDYIILHELMHVREMNHSPRFWRHVAAVCPDYRVAERWLKENGPLLLK